MKDEAIDVALIGGGPSALFMFRRLIGSNLNVRVTIFERTQRLGAGMPYSKCGSGDEHVTNVSSNEIPDLPQPPHEWLQAYNRPGKASCHDYSPYRVFPRRLFGDYLEAQFHDLLETAKELGIKTTVMLNNAVKDIQYKQGRVIVITHRGSAHTFDKAVICTGHQFPTSPDEAESGYYRSPYPPQKLALNLNHAVALRGASLTAVDAIKTLARANGQFVKKQNGTLVYKLLPQNRNFKMVLHCRSGMLPAVRFHLADPRLKNPMLLTTEQIECHRKANGGFLSLDYVFEKDFKEPLKHTDPVFYEKIKQFNMEEFVQAMLQLRERVDPFALLKAEYNESRKSIKRKKPVCWKEMLGVLSFALNYPAKYFSAEDMIRYKTTLHPLISLVIAYIPQSSCRELLALHKAGCLELVHVDKGSRVEHYPGGGITYYYTDQAGKTAGVNYKTYVDCTGQPHIDFKDFPFQGLVQEGIVRQARLAFRDTDAAKQYELEHPGEVEVTAGGALHLTVPGIAVNDHFQVVEDSGMPNEALYIMAVPYMGGFNPDYSGLDFAEEASQRIIDNISGQAGTITILKMETANAASSLNVA